jgi:hypothetical protein
VRVALLAGVGLGALAVLAPDGAYAVDGTWLGGQPPSVTEWNQGSNWSSNPTVPDDIATFTSGVNTTVWPAPGSEDTELGVILEPEVVYGTQTLCTRVQA